MTKITNSERADIVFKSLCKELDRNGWNYHKDTANRIVNFTLFGKDLPIVLTVNVNKKRQIVVLYSQLPFVMPEEKRIEGAIAACAYTYCLTDGSFDYNINNGNIVFRLTQSFINRTIGDELFQYIIDLSTAIVEEYNDKFFRLSKGLLSIDDILSQSPD